MVCEWVMPFLFPNQNSQTNVILRGQMGLLSIHRADRPAISNHIADTYFPL